MIVLALGKAMTLAIRIVIALALGIVRTPAIGIAMVRAIEIAIALAIELVQGCHWEYKGCIYGKRLHLKWVLPQGDNNSC